MSKDRSRDKVTRRKLFASHFAESAPGRIVSAEKGNSENYFGIKTQNIIHNSSTPRPESPG